MLYVVDKCNNTCDTLRKDNEANNKIIQNVNITVARMDGIVGGLEG